jgi:hypothetical protein
MFGLGAQDVAQQAQQVRAPARGGHEVLDAVRGQRQPDAVVVAHGREPEHGAQFRGQLALLLARGAEAHRTRHVHHQHDGEFALLDETLHERRAEARAHVPVDVAHFVAGHVVAHFLELDAAALEHALRVAGEQILDQVPAADLEPVDLAQQVGGLHQGTRTCSRMRRATSSPLTPSASAS